MALIESLSSSSTLQLSRRTASTPLVESPTVQRSGNPSRMKPTFFCYYNDNDTKVGVGGSPGPDEGGLLGGLEELIVEGMASSSLPAPTYLPLVSPRHDIRDNPFNLAGFFPSRPGSPDHPVEWARRGSAAVEETETGAYSYKTTEAEKKEKKEKGREREGVTQWGNVLSARSLSLNALDEYAREVIAKESNKLGILGIVRVPSFFKSIRDTYFGTLEAGEGEEEVIGHASEQSGNINVLTPEEEEYAASPTVDEPFDAETLCESIHSRRVAAEREATGNWERVPSLGLFSVVVEETVEADTNTGWSRGLLYTK